MKRVRSKIIKRILWVLLIIWCSGIFLNGYVGIGEHVHAQEAQNGWWVAPTTSPATDTTSIWQILNMVLKLVYLLLWPLLVVAWLALDNTLVYASIFHLDAPLWQFWNMMKNFANFALWFMVLFAIIKSIFSNSWAWSAKDEKSPLGIIKVTLIAGILIQASWFIVAALVDISTVATYAVGWLPLSVLQGTAVGNQRILAVNSSINLNQFNLSFGGGEDFKVGNSARYPGITLPDQTVNISPCRISHSYVIWRLYGDTGYNNYEKLKSTTGFKELEVCALYGTKLIMWPEKALFTVLQGAPYSCSWCTTDNTQTYKKGMDFLIGITWWDANTGLTKNMIYIWSWESAFATGNLFFNGTDSLTISTLIQKSKWFVGPLVTIYSSLLNFAQLTDTNVTSASWTSGIFIIKSLVAIALFFPLIALALVLIARIGVLRLYIVASPFIILKESFKLKMGSLDSYLSVKSVIWIIFAPVVTVAALSISLIFMTALVKGFSSTDTNSAIHEALGIQSIDARYTGNDAISFEWIASLEFSKLPRGQAMDRFSWLRVNFFAIGLMRLIFFAAMKSNELGKSIGGQVEKVGENIFRTMPILPIGWWVGIGSATNVLKQVPDRWIADKNSEQNKIVQDYVYGSPDKWTPLTTIDSSLATKLITSNATAADITKWLTDKWVKTADIGTVLNSSTAELFTAVNALKQNKDQVIKAIGEAGAGADWYTKYETTQKATAAKKTLDAFINGKKPTNENTLIWIVQDVWNKAAIEEYFTSAGADANYEIVVGKETYKLTRTVTWTWTAQVIKYDVVKSTPATTPTPTTK